MWDLPGPGIKPKSPALQGGSHLTTGPPGKPSLTYSMTKITIPASQGVCKEEWTRGLGRSTQPCILKVPPLSCPCASVLSCCSGLFQSSTSWPAPPGVPQVSILDSPLFILSLSLPHLIHICGFSASYLQTLSWFQTLMCKDLPLLQ